MAIQEGSVLLTSDDPTAVELVRAIRTGDVGALDVLLRENEGLASRRIHGRSGSTHTALHIVTDWPGYFAAGPEIVQLLIESGADPSAPVEGGRFAETPLHAAASTDDLDVALALIDGGADLEAAGASIGGGAPLNNAVAYGCWNVARLLVARGARVDQLWHAAALGMLERIDTLLNVSPPPSQEEINDAFWQTCHGGQRRAAEVLLARGAEMNWVPSYADTTGLDMASGIDTRRELLVEWLRERGAEPSAKPA